MLIMVIQIGVGGGTGRVGGGERPGRCGGARDGRNGRQHVRVQVLLGVELAASARRVSGGIGRFRRRFCVCTVNALTVVNVWHVAAA